MRAVQEGRVLIVNGNHMFNRCACVQCWLRQGRLAAAHALWFTCCTACAPAGPGPAWWTPSSSWWAF